MSIRTSALVTSGTDHTLDVGFHQQLRHGLRHVAQEIIISSFGQQLRQRQSVLGYRVLRSG